MGVVEPEALRFNLDVLLNKWSFRNVAKNDVLGIVWQDCDLVRDATRLCGLLLLQLSLKLVSSLSLYKLDI